MTTSFFSVHTHPKIIGTIYASIAGILWGLEYLAVSYIYNTSPVKPSALGLTVSNYFGAFLIALLCFGWKKSIRERVKKCVFAHFIPICSLGAIVAMGIFLLIYSVTKSSAGSTSLLERIQLLFIIFMGVVFLDETISKKQIFGIIISIIGFTSLSAFPSDLSPFVGIAILSGAFLFSWQSFIVKKWMPNVDGFSLSFIRVGIAGTLLFFAFLFLDDISSFPSYISTIGVAVAGFFGVFVGRYFYFEAHNLLPISFLNVFMLLEAVVVVSGEMLFFPFVPFSWTKIFAGSTILLGLGILATQGEQSSKKWKIAKSDAHFVGVTEKE